MKKLGIALIAMMAIAAVVTTTHAQSDDDTKPKSEIQRDLDRALKNVEKYRNDPLRRALWLNEVSDTCLKASTLHRVKCKVTLED